MSAIPREQILGFVLGEISASGPWTNLEIFEHIEADHSKGMEPGLLTSKNIAAATAALQKLGCISTTSQGWLFVRWPAEGHFGDHWKCIDQPAPEVKPAPLKGPAERRPAKLKQSSFF